MVLSSCLSNRDDFDTLLGCDYALGEGIAGVGVIQADELSGLDRVIDD